MLIQFLCGAVRVSAGDFTAGTQGAYVRGMDSQLKRYIEAMFKDIQDTYTRREQELLDRCVTHGVCVTFYVCVHMGGNTVGAFLCRLVTSDNAVGIHRHNGAHNVIDTVLNIAPFVVCCVCCSRTHSGSPVVHFSSLSIRVQTERSCGVGCLPSVCVMAVWNGEWLLSTRWKRAKKKC